MPDLEAMQEPYVTKLEAHNAVPIIDEAIDPFQVNILYVIGRLHDCTHQDTTV